MPNYKLSVSQRNHDKTGWHSSTQFQDDDINNIKIHNSRSDKSLNAIPSPLARIHLFESAFSLVYQDELHGTNVSGDAYKKIVSDCFDVFELLFNWNNHIREGKELKIISWNREIETTKLKKEFIEEKALKEAELKKNPKENQSLNLQQIRGFKEHLVGDTLNLFLQTGAFANFNEIHIILYNNRPIAGTSPLTGFFTTPNDLSNIGLVNPNNNKSYFSRHIPFSHRESKIKQYIYNFFVTHGVDLFAVTLPIRKYLESYANRLGNAVLKLEPLDSTENEIFNQSIKLQSNKEKGVSDYFEKHLVRVNYQLNDECFFTPANNLKSDRRHDYLLPLTPNFFEDFKELSDISSKITINEKDLNKVEVIIRKGNETLSKTYISNPIDDKDGSLIDLAETHSIKLDLGIFPFIKVIRKEKDSNGYEIEVEVKNMNDFYRLMFVCSDKIDNPQFSNDDFKINFGKSGELIDPNSEFRAQKENRTILEKDKAIVGSTYYSLNYCFDFLQIEFPNISTGKVKSMIVPKWKIQKIGDKQIDFAIDFGTTSTFVAWTNDPTHTKAPKRFKVVEERLEIGQNEQSIANAVEKPIPIVALLNKPKAKRAEWRWVDCFEGSVAMPDFYEFFEVQKQEFVPTIINDEKYTFPFRTAVYEKKEISANRKSTLLNSNIAFAYLKDFDSVTHLNQSYITNLKWNIKSHSYKESIEVFIEELFYLMRIKALLLGGNPSKSNVFWFSPLSFTPGAQFNYNEIWSTKYSKVFKGNSQSQLRNITESEAPFYYYSKIQEDEGGAERIEDTSSVLTLDIGGGTTDIMYFRDGKPTIGTSVHFGANVIWGDGYSDFTDSKFNGIYLSLRNTISDRIEDLQVKAINKEFNKSDSNFGSDEIINFWIWNDDKTKVTTELKKGDFKLSYLLHLSSLIYHSCKLLQFYHHPSPKCILFTGNGSKYLDLIQTKDYIQKICGYFIKELFGSDTKKPQIIMPSTNRKEATCFGGLYQPFNAGRDFTPVNYLGFESPDENFKKYSEIDLKKEQVYDSLENSFSEFINCFFKMNDSQELSFKRNFSIEANLNAVKSFMLSKTRENLSTGYDKRRKMVDGGDEITDSLFFYPFVGLIYQLNKLNKEKLNEYLPRTRFFALSPDNDTSFDISRLSIDQKPDSIFSISIDNSNPDFGEITLIDDISANKRAMAGINGFLKSVCEFSEFPENATQSIHVLEPGTVEKEKETGRWKINKKIKIEFIS